MKKSLNLLFVLALLTCLLAGCGTKAPGGETQVDLEAFMTDTLNRYELGSVEAVGDELTDAFYPGLRDIDTVQRIVYMPLITGVVSEYVLLQCADSENAEKAAALLQKRVDEQAAGGAWYPESVANWAKAKVIVRGTYVVMLAAGEATDAIAADFENLF